MNRFDCAKAIGISVRLYTLYERARAYYPSSTTLLAICRVLGVKPDYLMPN